MVRWEVSSELIMCGGDVRSILLFPLVDRCLETIKTAPRPGYVVKVRPDPGYVVKQCPRIVMNKIFDWH